MIDELIDADGIISIMICINANISLIDWLIDWLIDDGIDTTVRRINLIDDGVNSMIRRTFESKYFIDGLCRGSSSDTTANKINPYYLIGYIFLYIYFLILIFQWLSTGGTLAYKGSPIANN